MLEVELPLPHFLPQHGAITRDVKYSADTTTNLVSAAAATRTLFGIATKPGKAGARRTTEPSADATNLTRGL